MVTFNYDICIPFWDGLTFNDLLTHFMTASWLLGDIMSVIL